MSDDTLRHMKETLDLVRRETGWVAIPIAGRMPTQLESVEQGRVSVLNALRTDSSSARTARLYRLVSELTMIETELRRDEAARQWEPMIGLHASVSNLRNAESHKKLIELAARELRTLGFSHLAISRVEGDRWIPGIIVGTDPSTGLETVVPADETPELTITRGIVEFELISRRRTIVVDRTINNPQVHPRLRSIMPVDFYVATPILMSGDPVGMIHASHGASSSVSEPDMALLSAFATCLGFAAETLTMSQRLHTILREATMTPDHILDLTNGLLQPAGQLPPLRGGDRTLRTANLVNRELTAREHEVLQLLATGKSNSEIASELVVSESTVKAHVKSILKKLGATNRAAAVAKFFQSG